jgi:simple sugar transport system permease protein
MNAVEFIIAGMLAAATPFLLAALGELVVERAGVLNLGVEGLMALGAAIAFIVTFNGGGHFLGFIAAGWRARCSPSSPSSCSAFAQPGRNL